MTSGAAKFAEAFASGRPELPQDLDEAIALLAGLQDAAHRDAARWVGWRAAVQANEAGRHEEEGRILATLVAALLPEPGEGVKMEAAREAERAAEMALGLAGLADDPAPLAQAWRTLGEARLAAGDTDGAVRALGEGLDLAEVANLELEAVWLRLLSALTLSRGGGATPDLASQGQAAAEAIARLCPADAEVAARVAGRIKTAG